MKMRKFFALKILVVLAVFATSSCKKGNKGGSSATGWKINSKEGGFQYNTKYKEQEKERRKRKKEDFPKQIALGRSRHRGLVYTYWFPFARLIEGKCRSQSLVLSDVISFTPNFFIAEKMRKQK